MGTFSLHQSYYTKTISKGQNTLSSSSNGASHNGNNINEILLLYGYVKNIVQQEELSYIMVQG